MKVTVLARRRARPGQADALLAAALDLFGERLARERALDHVRLLQQLDDPHSLLFLGDWASHDAYWAGLPDAARLRALDVLCAEPVERAFFRRLATSEVASRQADAFRALLVDVPAVPIERVLAERAELVPCLRALPAFVSQSVYQDLNHPGRLLLLYGWTSVEDLHQGHARLCATWRDSWLAQATRVTVFGGRAHVNRGHPPVVSAAHAAHVPPESPTRPSAAVRPSA